MNNITLFTFRSATYVYERYNTVFTFDPPKQNSLYVAFSLSIHCMHGVTLQCSTGKITYYRCTYAAMYVLHESNTLILL